MPDYEDTPYEWERQTGESAQAFHAFTVYLNLDDRSIRNAWRKVHPDKENGNAGGRWNKWSSKWEWPQRALAYDRHRKQIEQKARDEVLAAEVAQLERKKAELRQKELDVAEKLLKRGEELLKYPITRVRTEDGTTIVEPVRWQQSDITQFFRVALQLNHHALDGIDDELTQFIARNNQHQLAGAGEAGDIATEDILRALAQIDALLEPIDRATLRPAQDLTEGCGEE